MIKSIISVGIIIVLIVVMIYFLMNPVIGVDFAKNIISLGFGAIKNSFIYLGEMVK